MPKLIPIEIGARYGNWEVVEMLRHQNTGRRLYRCRCACGRFIRIGAHGLVNEIRTKCRNCACREIHEIEQFSGKIFGRWTVLERIPPEERKSPSISWRCRCDCGRIRELSVTQLKREGGCKKCAGVDRRLRPYEYVYRTIRSRILNRYDRDKTQDFTISYEEFARLVGTGRCHYCHTAISWVKHGGTAPSRVNAHYMDRKDNAAGYVPGNVVACCTRCNFGKGARFSYEEWYMMTACFRVVS